MFLKATYAEINELKILWEKCFTTESYYIDNFFHNCFPVAETLVIKKFGKIISTATLIPATVDIFNTCNDHHINTGVYIYAVATHPEYRNKGYSKSLIKYILEYSISQKYSFAALYPAHSELYDMYGKMGFKNLYSTCFNYDQKYSCDLSNLVDILKIQNSHLNSNSPTLHFNQEFHTFILNDIKGKGGFILFDKNRISTIAIPEESNINNLDIISVRKESDFSSIKSLLERHSSINHILPFNEFSKSHKSRRGMIYIFDEQLNGNLSNLFISYTIE